MKILIVDDHLTDLKLLRKVLEGEDHFVIESRDGGEALAFLDRELVDVVISDVLMPNIDGYSLCRAIRRSKRLGHIPFVIYTANYTSPNEEKLAFELGVDKYLRKPATSKKILHAIHESVQSKRHAPTEDIQDLDVVKPYSEKLVERLEESNLELFGRNHELQSAHSKLRHLLVHSPAVLYTLRLVNDQIQPTVISDNLERILGQRPEDNTGDWWQKCIHPDDYDRVLATTAEGLKGDGSFQEYRIKHSDGNYRWIEDSSRVVRGSHGEVSEVIGVWTDITERIHAEGALRRSEDQFREMLENVDLIALMIDKQGKLTFCNDYFLRMTGWEREDIIGSIWFSKFFPKADDQRKNNFLNSIKTGEIPLHYETTIKTKTGELRDVIWSNTALRDSNGLVGGIASIGEDVTERNHAIAALQEMNKELENRVQERTAALEQTNIELHIAKELAEMASQAKSAFLSRMSHEFRTPMNAILGFGQLLALTDLEEMQQDSVNHILKGGRHLLSLINDVLDISRIEIDTFGISLEPVYLSEIIAESVAFLRSAAAARRISIEVPPSDLIVKADAQRLRQVFLNLVSNAIKYNIDNGKIWIRVSQDNEGHVFADVEDTGIGISRIKQQLLFTPFERLGAESKNIEGTGLGLALSKSLVEAMGGTLTFSSSEGKGSLFRVTLSQSSDKVEQRLIDRFAGLSKDGTDLERSRVLVIEDNMINYQLIERVLSFRGDIEFLSAREGGLGIALAATNKPNVILLDLHLPDMAGKDVLKELRENQALRNVPIIIISADAYSSQRESLLRAGAFRYITKPFELEILLEAVDAGIEENRAHD